MAWLSNQVVCVCAFLSNFQPALVPQSSQDLTSESDIDDYFQELYLTDSEASLSDTD